MYDTPIRKLPEGFVSHHQCLEIKSFLNIPPPFKPEPVGAEPRGVRWHIGPLHLERYISDTEPDISKLQSEKNGHARFVLWYRLTRDDVPAGWHMPVHRSQRLEGFSELKPNEDYAADWSQSARRYRNRWRTQANITQDIVDISIIDFANAYRHSTVHQTFGSGLIDAMQRKYDSGLQGNIFLRAVRDLKSGRLLAGMGTIDSPSSAGSFYECGFVTPDADPSYMVALMDDWFKRSQTKGLRFLHFGAFAGPHSPQAWRGFSLFKSKFCSQYIELRPALVRFVRGKLW